jgi:hypothetical protein
MTEITFTGNLDQITSLIDSYKAKGYVYKSHTEQSIEYLAQGQKRKMILYSVTMQEKGYVSSTFGGFVNVMLRIEDEMCKYHPAKPLAEQLTEAVEREDYETAAILRDKINKK